MTLSPLLYLILRTFDGGTDKVLGLLFRQRTADLALRTLSLTAVVVVGCVVLGSFAAWMLTRTNLPGRRLLSIVLAAPLAIPSYVAGYVWIAEFPGLAGFSGAALVLVLSCFPLVMLPVAAALAAADPGAAEVARTLGRGTLRTAITVELRQVAPAGAAGALLVALYTISDFGAVALMRYEAFTLGIYSAYQGGLDRTAAAVFGLVLVSMASVMTLAERRSRRAATARLGLGSARTAETVSLGRWAAPVVVSLSTLVCAALVVPIVGLLRWLLRSLRLTIDWGDVLATSVTTLQYSALAAAIVTVAAVPVALLAARSSSSVGRIAELSTYIAHGLPGITVGLAVVFFGIRFLPAFYQTATLLMIAYLMLFLPLAIGSTRSVIAATPTVLDDVARTLGSGQLRTDMRVVLPIATPGVVAGAALVFLTVSKELPATLMLRPRGVDTLATELWSTTQVFKYGEAAPYALALILVSAVPTMVLHRILQRRNGTRNRVQAVG